MTGSGLYGRVAAVGVGRLQFKRGAAPYSERELLVRAIVAACADAGLDPADVDGFVSYGDDRHNEPVRLMPELGTRELTLSTQIWGGGGAGMIAAFEIAAAMIAAGQCRHIIVFRAIAQGSSGRLGAAVMAHFVNDHYTGAGIVAPTQFLGLRARRVLSQHRIAPSVIEALVRADYYHAARNPEAVAFGNHFRVEDYRDSRWVVEPLRLYDCSRENDGAGAVLLTSAERARDLAKKPVFILGAVQGCYQGAGDLLENDDDYSVNGFAAVAQRLWAKTGLSIKDMDCAQVYENFTYLAVAALIEHGFSSWEAAAEDFTFENLIAPHGRFPVNTSGGNLAEGFIHGMNTAIEAVRQLRGESSNPVPNARTCLVTAGPGAPSSSAVFANEIP